MPSDSRKKWVGHDGRAHRDNSRHPLRVDRDALHRLLAGRTDHFGRIKIDLRPLSEEVGINYTNLSGIIHDMATEGRLRKVGGTRQGQKTYIVSNPREWAAATVTAPT